ncbi:MAG: hypothetical protein K2X03_31480 [Bryobacteraceae bacterium]|nr:hypothetical protein [Bryobacteraceae bacterium]
MIRVIKAGASTRLVDGIGARRRAHLGVSIGGAADRASLARANALVQNPPSATGLEMTLLGASLGFLQPAIFALSGAPFAATLNEVPVPYDRAIAAEAGAILRVASGPAGIRAYCAIRGGLRQGYARPLRSGDTLEWAGLPAVATSAPPPVIRDGELRVTLGHAFTQPLLQGEYEVTTASNRQAIFLSGAPIAAGGGHMITEGVPLGAIQLPPSGQPMILFVDQQTTGGYPVIACVIQRDLPKVGQLRPQQRVTFRYVTFEEAHHANRSER